MLSSGSFGRKLFCGRGPPLAGRRIEKAQILAVSLQMKIKNLTRKSSLQCRDRVVFPANEAVALHRRLQIITKRIEEKIFFDLEHILIEMIFLLLIFSPCGLRSQLNHHIGRLALFPNQEIRAGMFLDPLNHEHIGRDMPPLVSRFVKDEQISRNINSLVPGVPALQSLDEGCHENAMPIGFRHGSPV